MTDKGRREELIVKQPGKEPIDPKQIVNGLRDKAARSSDQSTGRVMIKAAHVIQYLVQETTMLRDALKELEAKQRWIPVTERLPVLHTDDYEEPDGSRMQIEVSDEQYVITASGCQKEARYETGPVFQGWVGEYGETVRNVTHWMPLPEPPKEA